MGEIIRAEALLEQSARGHVSAQHFRHAMRSLAGAVSVVTTGRGEARIGFTATSVASLAIDPPSVIVCLDRSSSSWPVLRTTRRFCVNILAEDQAAIADRFAGRGGLKGRDRFGDAHWRETARGTWALTDALVSLDCVVEEAIERHSHAIVIGAVEEVTIGRMEPPLLYWQGAYRALDR